MVHICDRRVLSGVSTGKSMAAEEAREAVEARPLSVATDDLRATAVEVLADLVETRPGMASIGAESLSYSRCNRDDGFELVE